jgi:signal transduction histidine kinase
MNYVRKAMIVSTDQSSIRFFSEFVTLKLKLQTIKFRLPAEALRAIFDDIDIIAADMKLPEISGLDFLSTVHDKHPGITGILLIDDGAEIDPIRAVNEAGLSYIFRKPLSIKQLCDGFEKIGLDSTNEDDVADGKKREDGAQTINRVIRAISHDIKAPLTIIRANADMLNWSETDDQKRRDLIKSLIRQSDKISNLIGEISSIAKGRWNPDIKPGKLDAVSLMSELITPFMKSAESRGVRILCNNSFTGCIMLDIDKMKRVLEILLINSIEAGGKDTAIHIRIENEGNYLALKFKDSGPGLPEGVMEKIFEPFVSSGKQRGAGLGLAIGRGIIGSHGGDIRCSNAPEGGAVFMIKLPVCRS